MSRKFVMTKARENVTKEDLQKFWQEALANSTTGELWCSQPNYLENNNNSVVFLYVGTDSELAKYLADGVFYLYASDDCDLSSLFTVYTNNPVWGNKEDFLYLSSEPTLIWKEGVFIAD